MSRYVIDEFYRDPGLRRRLFEHAREERNRALGDGLRWLARRLKALVSPRPRAMRWTTRLS